jgi:hypothetical protein
MHTQGPMRTTPGPFLLGAMVLAGLALLAMGVPVQGQAASAGTLYLTPTKLSEETVTTVGCGVEESYALTAVAPTAAAGSKVKQLGVFASSCTVEFEYVTPTAFTLGASGEAKLYISCDQPTAIRPGSNNGVNNVASVRVTLQKNGQDVSANPVYLTGATDLACTGSTDILAVTVPVNTANAAYEAGDKLSLKAIVWWANPNGATVQQGYYVVYGTGQPSGFTAPGLPSGAATSAGGETIYRNVTAAVFDESVEGNVSSDTYHYNWTQGPANATVTYNATGTGNATLIVTDASGAEVANQTVAAPGNGTLQIANATAGNWTVRYVLENLTGTFTARIAVPPAGNGTGNGTGGDGSGTGTSTGTGTGGSGTSTGTGTGTQGKGGNGDGEETDEALLDKLTSDPAYLYTSAGGAAAVLAMSIIGLAGRWRL